MEVGKKIPPSLQQTILQSHDFKTKAASIRHTGRYGAKRSTRTLNMRATLSRSLDSSLYSLFFLAKDYVILIAKIKVATWCQKQCGCSA